VVLEHFFQCPAEEILGGTWLPCRKKTEILTTKFAKTNQQHQGAVVPMHGNLFTTTKMGELGFYLNIYAILKFTPPTRLGY
jgi:hypothetical protein